jgi:predicted metal-binding membrane protein
VSSDADGAGIAAPPPPSAAARLLSRTGLITGLCLAAVAALAWLWLWREAAGMDMDMAGMATVRPWTAGYLASAFLMWALMMVAMMLPSAAPMILFYDMFARRNRLGAGAVLLFASTYVAIWAAFSALAALLQAVLVAAGAADAMALVLGSRRAAGILLVLAGAWQLGPVKRACLASCRSPVDFLMRRWRPGRAGALRLGAAHGLYCLGCCWALMLLLFVGGVMNLAWIAALAALVLAEKYAPLRWRLSEALAVALLAGGVGLIVAG